MLRIDRQTDGQTDWQMDKVHSFNHSPLFRGGLIMQTISTTFRIVRVYAYMKRLLSWAQHLVLKNYQFYFCQTEQPSIQKWNYLAYPSLDKVKCCGVFFVQELDSEG